VTGPIAAALSRRLSDRAIAFQACWAIQFSVSCANFQRGLSKIAAALPIDGLTPPFHN
jgi:hypothetical protein